MSRTIHLFDPPDRFSAGTLGEPGSRTFFLQAVQGPKVVSVILEKSQLSAITERLAYLLRALKKNHISGERVGDESHDTTLSLPILEEFRVGLIALTWLEDRGIISLTLQALTSDGEMGEEISDEEEEDAPDILRVNMSVQMAAAFANRSELLISAGRPPCPFCSLPLDPNGHLCPRENGYRR